MENEVMDLLTQGSVWKKNSGQKAGRQAKLLFLTNTTLPVRVQEKHPVQVIYADDESNIYNRSIEEFTSQYSFFNVDGELESRLEGLLVFNEDDAEEETDEEIEASAAAVVARSMEAVAAAEGGAAPLTANQIGLVNKQPKSFADSLLEDETFDAVDGDDVVEDEGQHPTVVQFTFGSVSPESATLTDYELASALVAYSQEPDRGNNMIKHRLLFALNQGVTIATLQEAFIPNDDYNTVDTIAVVGPHFSEVVPWTDYLGVYPEMAAGRAFATVLLGEDLTPTSELVVDAFDEANAAAEIQNRTPGTEALGIDVPQALSVEVQQQIARDVAAELNGVLPTEEEVIRNTVENTEAYTPAEELPPFEEQPGTPKVSASVQAQVANLIQNIAPKPQQ